MRELARKEKYLEHMRAAREGKNYLMMLWTWLVYNLGRTD